MEAINRFVTIDTADPDDARRRRLLNIILFGTGIVIILTVLTTIITVALGLGVGGEVFVIITSIAALLGFIGIYAINRYVSGRYASTIFLLFLMGVMAFSDTPMELANGRSLFEFVVPIIIASVLLAPAASFVFLGLVTVEITLLATSAGVPVNTPAVTGFALIALLSWLSARSLEQALREVRATNANLDRLVTERTQALAEALTRQRIEAGRSHAILSSIADGVIVFDKDRRSILANPAITNLLGMKPVQIVDKTFEDVLQASHLSELDRGLLLAMMDTEAQSSSFRVQWEKKTLSVSAAQVQDTAGEEIGTVAVFRDITREAELERMKSSFIAIVSHELRTPLNAIMGFAEMIKEAVYGPVNEKQAEASQRILMNTQHMLGMVGDLLDQAQIEAGKLKIITESFRPAELLSNVDAVMGQIVAEKSLSLTSELDPRLPETVSGDSHRLQQILMNLVNNSIKFTESGNIHIRLFMVDTDHWGLEVKDTGRGIPKDELGQIFEPFHQVDSSTTRQQGGFGLGLSIVRQLVELMDGEIQVQSQSNLGTTFSITLPLIEEKPEMKQAMSRTALIIEDDADLASIFAEALKSAGYEPQVISDGAVAQRKIQETIPHIVILDLHLPHVDGSTLLTQIRADGALKNTIVIVATADALMGELYRDAADIVLIKPISFTQLRDLSSRLRAAQLKSALK